MAGGARGEPGERGDADEGSTSLPRAAAAAAWKMLWVCASGFGGPWLPAFFSGSAVPFLDMRKRPLLAGAFASLEAGACFCSPLAAGAASRSSGSISVQYDVSRARASRV